MAVPASLLQFDDAALQWRCDLNRQVSHQMNEIIRENIQRAEHIAETLRQDEAEGNGKAAIRQISDMAHLWADVASLLENGCPAHDVNHIAPESKLVVLTAIRQQANRIRRATEGQRADGHGLLQPMVHCGESLAKSWSGLELILRQRWFSGS